MRILSYNIWNYDGDWPIRRQLLTDVMSRASPDLIALQEVRHNWNDRPGWNQARFFADGLDWNYAYRPANIFLPFPPLVEGLAFLWPSVSLPVQSFPVPKTGRGPRRIILRAQLSDVDVYNVHFALSNEGRMVESGTLLDIVERRPSRPAILTGDFNADAGDGPMQTLFNAGFHDVWQEVHDRGDNTMEWPDPRRIDYILARDVDLRGASIDLLGVQPEDGLLPSDHFGLLADIPSLKSTTQG